ncbi:hypothetical protein LJR130_003030 [Variovorax sp. LjRoot130]|uniref:hypothetical protein n=1 Tax=Variovorax sp. LjRoot130 TaxID=3342261 RepID=UPI003ECD0F4F
MDLVEQALQEKLPEVAVSFFVVFSRFECAMKRIGIYALGDDKGVEADWNRLASDLGQRFLDEVIASGIAPILIGKPPKKQVKLADGTLGWRDMGAVQNSTDLFLAIRRARNNLIHGGKYQDDGSGYANLVAGAERNDALLGQAMAVLRLALESRPDLRNCYFKY